MSDVTWTINETPLDELGLRLVSGSFRTMTPSVMRLERSSAFDASEILAYGTAVTLARVVDEVSTPFFTGKIASIPKGGSASDEFQIYEIEDSWADLQETIYQEEWAYGATTILMPKFVMGMVFDGTNWVNADPAAQIESIINYAIDQGINLQLGSLPTGGQLMIPSEHSNTSCAEAIALCLKQLPDWIPWIDHSTTPPTFNVTKVSAMSAETIPVNGTGSASDVQVLKRDDLLPASVRIIYEFATTIDNEVFRNIHIDKYPVGGPDGGPKVLQATIPLQGMQMQMQKSRIQTRTLPSDNATLIAWLKLKLPHIADIPDAEISVISGSVVRTLVADSETHADPINPNATRLSVADVDDLPRELVRGSIEDWMRRKVGTVRVAFKIAPNNTTEAANRKLLENGIPPFIQVTATDAVTKLYKGITQWIAPEDVPTGIAQQTYQSIHASMPYQGSVTLTGDEVTATRYHGKKLNLSGGVAGWATMASPIHSVDFDIDTGRTTIAFGPIPYLAPADFIEMQRILRYRPVTWWSFGERESPEFGGEEKASAKGDSVGAYDLPQTAPAAAIVNARLPFAQRSIINAGGGSYTVTIWPGYIREIITQGGEPPPDGVILIMPEVGGTGETPGTKLDADPPPTFTLMSGEYLAVRYQTDKYGTITGTGEDAPTVVVTAEKPETVHYQPPDADGSGGVEGLYYIVVGRLTGAGDEAFLKPWFNSDVEHYHDILTGENVGTGGKIYKRWHPPANKHQYRTVNGRFGLTHETAEDQVELDAELANQGTGAAVWMEYEGIGEDPPVAPPDEPIKLRTIRALASDEDTSSPPITPQIQVTVEDEPGETADPPSQKKTIRIRGNAIRGRLRFLDCNGDPISGAEITWEDGLVTTSGDIDVQITPCDTPAPPP